MHVRSYTSDALYGAAPVTEFATGRMAIGVAAPVGGGFAPMVAQLPMAEAPAAPAFRGLTFADIASGRSFWRSEAGGFIYFLIAAVLLNARLVNRGS